VGRVSLVALFHFKETPHGCIDPFQPLRADIRVALRRFERINRLIEDLTGQLIQEGDLAVVLKRVLEKVFACAKAERGFIALCDAKGAITHSVATGEEEALFDYSRSAIEWVLANRASLWVQNAQVDNRLRAQDSVIALNLHTLIVVPLMGGAELFGFIYLDRTTLNDQFTQSDLHTLESIAHFVTLAVHNARLNEGIHTRLQKLQVINEVSLAINAVVKLDELLSLILQQSLSLSGGDRGYILLGEGEGLECLARLDSNGNKADAMEISHSLVARCIKEERSICILDTHEDTQFQTKSVMALELRSIMCIPLLANQKLVGVLYISSHAITKTFTPQDQSLLEAIANQAALTIRNAQLLKEQERQIGLLGEALENYRKAEKDSQTDILTELNNRRFFDLQAAREIDLSLRHNRSFAVILLDIDHFKQFNDTYGHAIGDVVLKAVGGVLTKSVRLYDVPARYGGEEFAVLLPDTNDAQALIVAERIREAIAEVALLDLEGQPVRQITASLGITTLAPQDKQVTTLLERADIALYNCKAQGRNQSLVWRPGLPGAEELKQREQGESQPLALKQPNGG
jgi:diguanylate cyclase (GGDEF)-like protein